MAEKLKDRNLLQTKMTKDARELEN